MKTYSIIDILFCLLLCIISCTPSDDTMDTAFPGGEGIFIVNEGNFMAGNGSVSFYSFDSRKVYDDVFSRVNGRPLGDVPNSMVISGKKGFIVVNNSGKIEVVEINSMKSVGSITNLNSPRQMLVINDTKAYVSSLYSTKLYVINTESYSVSGQIEIRRSSEAMLMKDNLAFVSCWSGGNEIIVINTLNDSVIDSIKVGQEPESMAFDKNGKLWVLCSGGYTGEYYPEIDMINTSTRRIEKIFKFDSNKFYPYSLCINSSGDTLYYIAKYVWELPVMSLQLPSEPLIKDSGRTYYKINAGPSDGRLYITNAVDYQQRGYLLMAGRNGEIIDSVRVGIIPGAMCFKVE